MALSEEQLLALAQRLEGFAAQRPVAYKIRLGLLMALAYVYILGVLAFLVVGSVVTAAVVWWGVVARQRYEMLPALGGVWFLAILAFTILRALCVRVHPPAGIRLKREDAPVLFGAVGHLQSALKAPRFHGVLLSEEMNAAVAQVPRLGVPGWFRNYLIVGLPLMVALSPQQFMGVLAHEMGHLSAQHGRFGIWVYRLRRSWDLLLDRVCSRRGFGTFIIECFLHWYSPLFAAYSFALARADEYAADRDAASLTGAPDFGTALASLDVNGRFLSEVYWPQIQKAAERDEKPPNAVYSEIPAALGRIDRGDALRWIQEELARKTNYSDTHPCLADRLRALGEGAPADAPSDAASLLAPPASESAAEHFLGSRAAEFAGRLDAAWAGRAAPQWAERHAYAVESLKSLDELTAKAQSALLAPSEAWNRARWTLEFHGADDGLPLLREVVASYPSHPDANYALGRLLLERNDVGGIRHIERALLDPESVPDARDLICGLLRKHGRHSEAAQYQERAEQLCRVLERALVERYSVAQIHLLPHGVPQPQVAMIAEQLSGHPDIVEAFLARTASKYLPDRPFYHLGVVVSRARRPYPTPEGDSLLQYEVQSRIELPGEGWVFVVDEGQGRSRRDAPIRSVPGSCIYRRQEGAPEDARPGAAAVALPGAPSRPSEDC